MNTELVIDIAKAVTSLIQSGEYDEPFIAERTYLPDFEIEQLTTARVVIVPSDRDDEPSTRSEDREEYSIDIGVMKRLERRSSKEIDPLLKFVSSIAAHIKRRDHRILDTSPRAKFMRLSIEPLFSDVHLRGQHAFFSVITATYRAIQ